MLLSEIVGSQVDAFLAQGTYYLDVCLPSLKAFRRIDLKQVKIWERAQQYCTSPGIAQSGRRGTK